MSLPKFTSPSMSLMIAWSFGLRASSAATRGRLPVMSCTFVVSRGILAMTSPGFVREWRLCVAVLAEAQSSRIELAPVSRSRAGFDSLTLLGAHRLRRAHEAVVNGEVLVALRVSIQAE